MGERAAKGQGSIKPFPGRPGLWRGRWTINGKTTTILGESREIVASKYREQCREQIRDEALGLPAASKRTVGEEIAEWVAPARPGLEALDGELLPLGGGAGAEEPVRQAASRPAD